MQRKQHVSHGIQQNGCASSKCSDQPGHPPVGTGWNTFRSTTKVKLLLLIYCLMYPPLFVRVLCSSLFLYALLYVLFSFAIILTRERERERERERKREI